MSFVQLADTRLQVVDRGHGPVLLLVHGFPLDHSMWREQWTELDSVCRVIAPDLRGFGGSGPAGDLLTMEQLADDLAELLVALRIEQPVILAGLSMGGYVAWQFFRRHRSRLAALILCDTRAAADTETVAQGREYLAQRVLDEGMVQVSDELIQKLFAESTRVRAPQTVQRVRVVMNQTAPGTVAAALRGMARRPDMSSLLPDIDCPTLVLCGRDDQLTPVAEMRAMADQLPRARWSVIDDAGHLAPLENPRAVNSACRGFIQELPAATG